MTFPELCSVFMKNEKKVKPKLQILLCSKERKRKAPNASETVFRRRRQRKQVKYLQKAAERGEYVWKDERERAARRAAPRARAAGGRATAARAATAAREAR